MTIRRFIEDDRAQLRRIYLETRQQTFFWLDQHSFNQSDFDRDTEGEKIWVCETTGTVTGFISVWEPATFIHHLFIHPDYSANGYGSQLLETCLDNIGYPAQLKCVTQNIHALDFYKKRGWQIIDGGIAEVEYYLMEKSSPSEKIQEIE